MPISSIIIVQLSSCQLLLFDYLFMCIFCTYYVSTQNHDFAEVSKNLAKSLKNNFVESSK